MGLASNRERPKRGKMPMNDREGIENHNQDHLKIAWANDEVPLVDLPRIEEVAFEKHPPRYKAYRFVLVTLLWIVPVAGFVVLASVFSEIRALWAALPLVFLVAASYVTIPIGYRRRAYALRTRDITYQKGWLFKSMITLPFNRIQHTEVSQGPIERKFRLATLKIFTAGGSSSDLAIPGLDQETAQELREFIAGKAALDD